MGVKRDIISEKELAIIIYAVRTGKDKNVEDFRRMYSLSRETASFRQAFSKVGAANLSTWKNSTGIQKALKEQREIYQKELDQYAQEKFKEWQKVKRNTDSAKEVDLSGFLVDGVNFQDRTEFLNFLNIQANKITDPKQKLDYLKLISDLMRLKESDNKANEEIQRFYTPVTCNECAIYLKIKEKQQR